MTFLNTMMLFGLAAAAIPILIHLFHRQRVSTVDFSSVTFIKHLNLHQSRALRLRQLLILLVRTLIILLAVLAFARPAVQGSFASLLGTGVHQKTSAVLILDNSYSMGAGDTEQSAFTYAREIGHRILKLLQDGDEGAIVFTASPPRAVPDDRPVLSMGRVRDALDDATVSSRTGDIDAALTLAVSLLSNTSTMNREIYLVTDLQRNDWQSLLESATKLQIDPDINLFVIPVTTPPVSNVSLDAVSVSGHLVTTKQPEAVVAAFTNRNTTPLRDRNVSVYVNGVKRGSQTISAEPGKSGTARFGLSINDPGHYAGYVELDYDDLLVDNRRYFTLTIPETIDVLVVADRESRYFLRQALSPSGSMRTPLNVMTASTAVLNGDRPGNAHVVVIDGEMSLSAGQLASLGRFVTSGGGLIIFLGGGVNVSSYNTALLPDMFACTIQGRVGSPGQRQSYVSLGAIDYEHPVFNIFQEQSGTLPDSPRFFSSYRLNLNPQARVLARFSDGVPAIVEGRLGRGKALLFASTLNTQWSDLPLKSLFVPLIHRGVRYVYEDFNPSGLQAFVGHPVERAVNWTGLDAPIALELPSGVSELLKPTVSIGGMSVIVPHTDDPGIYRLQSGERLIGEFAVNVDTNESDPTRLTELDVGEILDGANVHFLPSTARLDQKLLQSQQGYEIWKLLLWTVLVLIVIESWFTRLPSRVKKT